MSEQRFTIQEASGMYLHLPIFDNGVEMADGDVCILLNEQQDTIFKLQDLCGQSDYENAKLRQEIKELKAQLREKEEDEQLYANEIVKLNKEAKEVLDFKSLGGDY